MAYRQLYRQSHWHPRKQVSPTVDIYRERSALPIGRPFEMYRDLSVGATLADSVNEAWSLRSREPMEPSAHDRFLLARGDGDRRSRPFQVPNLSGPLRSQFVNFLGKLRALLALDDFDVVLRLQIEPELRIDTKCQA